MAGRNAYQNMAFHHAGSTHDESIADSYDSSSMASVSTIHQSRHLPFAHASHELIPEETESRDYLAGLFLMLLVLMIGATLGYFAKGVFDSPGNNAPELSILGTEPVSTFEPLQSGANLDVVFLGSSASDQVLDIEPIGNGDALMLIKTYTGSEPGASKTRLIAYSASNSHEKGHALKDLKSLKGEGLYLRRLSGGELFALTAKEGSLSVMRLNENGRTVWTKSFNTSVLDRTDVAIAEHNDGLIFMAPAEQGTLFRIALIHPDGETIWEQTFDRTRGRQEAMIGVDSIGQTYAVLGPPRRSAGSIEQNIAMISATGGVLRQRLLSLQHGEGLKDIIGRPDGGVAFLISGQTPRLIQLDSTGQSETSFELPHMEFSDQARLLGIENGKLLSASTFDLMAGRVDLLLDVRSSDGSTHSQRSISMPPGARLGGIAKVNDTEYLISGSLQRDYDNREVFKPADLFIQRIVFDPMGRELVLTNSTESEQTIPDKASNPTLDTEIATVDFNTIAQSRLDAESVPVIQPPSVDQEKSENEALQTVSFTRPDERIIEESRASQSITTQCRFSCLDKASGAIFPMTGQVSLSAFENIGGLTQVHADICDLANLTPVTQSTPDCRGN